MAWIELHQSIWTHKKTLILASLLDIDDLYAAAHMIKLWTWALDNAQDGDISGLPSKVIAFGAGWKGDPEQFVQAAVKAGWFDREGDRLIIHDWFVYAGKLIEKREANKERARKSRERLTKQARDESEPCAFVARNEREDNAHVAGLPNLTIPNKYKDAAADARACEEVVPEPLQNTDEPQTVMDAYQSVFKTFHMTGQAQGFVQSLYDRGFDDAFVREIILETGEAATRPNLRYMREVAETWIKNGIRTRKEAAALKQTSKNRESPARIVNGQSEIVRTTEEEAEWLAELARKQAERNQAARSP